MITVLWETKAEIVERVLPPPLKPVNMPVAMAFIANYHSTNQGLPYYEGALTIRCEYEGESGNYYLAMPVTDDRAMIGGREIFGFPKKLANVMLERKDKEIYAYSERLGVKNIEIRAKLTGKFNAPETPKIISELGLLPGRKRNTINYNFKYFPAPNKEGFDYNPWLVKQQTAVRPKSLEMGEVKITLNSTEHDPWGEIEVVKPLGGLYLKTDNTMFPGEKIAEVDSEIFLPYSYVSWDWY
ncbi:MAG: acetoacetate decarboxylase [Candidatus Lokiarchaeota archaeon]|nr:acetoacetate decarboxylase [Candidatus Lokiarchaeota archaeon]MBD3341333.1 acetoacetate decarboxylase [Candidatus Lokiarchaeota archaeon]